MSFSNLKKTSKQAFKQLSDQMGQEGKKSYDDARIWSPDVDKSGSGFAVIRFLPAIEGEETPYVKLYTHNFKVGTKWFIDNCLTSIEQECPVCKANGELWQTGSKSNQDLVRTRKRKLKYYSNILVVSDAKRPQNEGKVFLFSYGAKIFAKMMNAIEPEFEDEKAFNPFDFWEGADFKLKIRDVEGYRNYDKSEFADCHPLTIGGKEATDAQLEAIWKQEHSLKDFLAADKFKSYEELQSRLNAVLSSGTSPTPAGARTARSAQEFDEDQGSEEQVRKPTQRASAAPVNNSDADDDFELFRTLVED